MVSIDVGSRRPAAVLMLPIQAPVRSRSRSRSRSRPRSRSRSRPRSRSPSWHSIAQTARDTISISSALPSERMSPEPDPEPLRTVFTGDRRKWKNRVVQKLRHCEKFQLMLIRLSLWLKSHKDMYPQFCTCCHGQQR